jgi:hypothetical protein
MVFIDRSDRFLVVVGTAPVHFSILSFVYSLLKHINKLLGLALLLQITLLHETIIIRREKGLPELLHLAEHYPQFGLQQ